MWWRRHCFDFVQPRSFRLFRDAINRETELGCITRDGEMEVIVAQWQEEMRNLCSSRENKDTISAAASLWDLSDVLLRWEDIKSPEKWCGTIPNWKDIKLYPFFSEMTYYWFACPYCLNVSILNYVRLKHNRVGYSAYRVQHSCPTPQKNDFKSNISAGKKQKMKIKLHHLFDDTENLLWNNVIHLQVIFDVQAMAQPCKTLPPVYGSTLLCVCQLL